jgi:flagellar motor protein MotB
MRRLERSRARSEEEESVFVTMTDMTISFLLIIMILLAFFATLLNDDETVPVSVYEVVRQERDDLRVENRNLLSSVEALEAELARLRSVLARVTSELEAVTSERDRLSREIGQLRDANEALEAELVLLRSVLARVTSELEAVTSERDRLSREIGQLRDANEAREAELVLLRSVLARVTSELEAVTSERDRLNREIGQLRDANEALQARVSDLEQESDQLRLRVVELLAEIQRLREERARLKAANPLEAYLSEAMDQRREIIVELRERLQIEFPKLQVEISPEQDALRFQGEGLFRSGSSRLEVRQRQIVEAMGRLLDEILVCFTLGDMAERGQNCDSGNALIEAVQIEGHTDSVGSDLNNLRLSTDRANATLLVMLDEDRSILAHQNLRGQPVMSVSGYGEMRPIETNETADGKSANRRIDLRIIMYAPSTVEEVEEVGRRLDVLRIKGGAE